MRKQTALWKTKDGKLIRICDMDDNHLRNTIKFLERYSQAKHSENLMAAYSIASIVTGEIASECIESDIMFMEEEGSNPYEIPVYEKMLEEKERREGRKYAKH